MSHNILFGKLKDYHVAGQKVTFDFEGDKGNLHPSVEMISDTIFNVFIDYDGLGHRTRAIEGELGQRLNNSPSESENILSENALDREAAGKKPWVSWEGAAVAIHSKKVTAIVNDGFAVDFYDSEGNPLSLAWRGERRQKGGLGWRELMLLAGEGHAAGDGNAKENRVQELRSLEKADCIYGLGDKTGFLNKRHYEYVMWNSDIPDPHEDHFKSL